MKAAVVIAFVLLSGCSQYPSDSSSPTEDWAMRTYGHPKLLINNWAVSPDESRLVVDVNGTLALVNLPSGTLQMLDVHPASRLQIYWVNDQTVAYATQSSDQQLARQATIVKLDLPTMRTQTVATDTMDDFVAGESAIAWFYEIPWKSQTNVTVMVNGTATTHLLEGTPLGLFSEGVRDQPPHVEVAALHGNRFVFHWWHGAGYSQRDYVMFGPDIWPPRLVLTKQQMQDAGFVAPGFDGVVPDPALDCPAVRGGALQLSVPILGDGMNENGGFFPLKLAQGGLENSTVFGIHRNQVHVGCKLSDGSVIFQARPAFGPDHELWIQAPKGKATRLIPP